MPIRPTRAEIDLGALTRNLATLHAAAPGVDVLAVVKADAYGHGAVPVSRALEAAGVRSFGVALVEEGLALRQAGLTSDILVLGGAYDGGWDAMLEHRMIPVVFRPEHLTALDAAATARGVTARRWRSARRGCESPIPRWEAPRWTSFTAWTWRRRAASWWRWLAPLAPVSRRC